MEDPRAEQRRKAARKAQTEAHVAHIVRSNPPIRLSKNARCVVRASGLAVMAALATAACHERAPEPVQIVNVTDDLDSTGRPVIRDHCGQRIGPNNNGTPPDQPCP